MNTQQMQKTIDNMGTGLRFELNDQVSVVRGAQVLDANTIRILPTEDDDHAHEFKVFGVSAERGGLVFTTDDIVAALWPLGEVLPAVKIGAVR